MLNPAKTLHGTDSLGTVAAGKPADLVLLDADPLADIINTTRVRAVIAYGEARSSGREQEPRRRRTRPKRSPRRLCGAISTS